MTTAFFFFLNQYRFDITQDSANFTLEVAYSWIRNPNAPPIEEIQKIANWLRPRVTSSGLLRGVGRFMIENTKLDEEGWESLLKPWIEITSKQIDLLSNEEIGHPTTVNGPSHQSKT